jgi:hypothetical protein
MRSLYISPPAAKKGGSMKQHISSDVEVDEIKIPGGPAIPPFVKLYCSGHLSSVTQLEAWEGCIHPGILAMRHAGGSPPSNHIEVF